MESESINTVSLTYTEFNCEGNQSERHLPIVIMHCALSERKYWEKIATELASITKRVVFTVDIRNHGDSPKKDGTTANYVADLEEFLRKKGISRSHFIGHSLGGKLQLLLAFEKPELFESLILVDFVPIPNPKSFQSYMVNVIRILRECLEELNESGITKLEEAKTFCEEQFIINGVIPRSFRDILTSSLKISSSGFDWTFQLEYLNRISGELGDFQTENKLFQGPTLVLAPNNSVYVTEKSEKEVRSILPKMTCIYMPNVSHHVHMDNPSAFSKHCLDFWSKLQNQRVHRR